MSSRPAGYGVGVPPPPGPVAGLVVAGRYRLRQPLGERAGWSTWRADDTLLPRQAAVTVVRGSGSPALAAAARRLASGDDPTHPRIYDVAEDEGLTWIVTAAPDDAGALDALHEAVEAEAHPRPAQLAYHPDYLVAGAPEAAASETTTVLPAYAGPDDEAAQPEAPEVGDWPEERPDPREATLALLAVAIVVIAAFVVGIVR